MTGHRKTFVATLCTALALVGLTGCAKGPKISRDDVNILFITLDTTRADQLGCYGNETGLTPNLDALAAEATVFEEAISPVPLTLPAHTSMMTGLYPLHHGVRINGWFLLAPEHITLAELLKEQSFATGAVISSYVLDKQFQLDQGFDFYDDDMSQGFQKNEFSTIERRADAITASGLDWLEAHRDRRFFLWLHYYDPHHPYDPPAGFNIYGDTEFLRYQGEIAYMDDHVGRVLRKLKEMGLYDRTLIIAVGDHGEAFGRNNEYGHALLIYNTTLHVPLIVRLPNIDGISYRAGRRVGGRVGLADILPTLLEILGIELTVPVDGHSLLPFLEGKEKDPSWPLYAETAQGKLTKDYSQLSGIYEDNWKYILAPAPELYDLSEDPTEQRNLAASVPSEAERMKDRLVALISQPATLPGSSTFEMDAEAEERLRSLGYIGGSSLPQESLDELENDLVRACQTGKDPKDMMDYNNLVMAASSYLVSNQPGRALRTLKKASDLSQGEIDDKLLNYRASAYTQLRLFDSAIETYYQLLELHPNDPGVLNNLALAYHNKGQSDRAVELLRDVVRRSPLFYNFHLNLGNVYDDLAEYDQADRLYAKALELAPNAAGKREEVRYNMALSLHRRGKSEDARSILENILQARPDHEQARSLLGTVQSRLGRERSGAAQ